MPSSDNQYSAAEQALGYIYQIRYALFQTLRLPETTMCFIEKDDDIDFTDPEEGKLLASLKHKAPGEVLTNLSPDFWKSVYIWANYLNRQDISTESTFFYLFTTGRVSQGSLLESFLPTTQKKDNLTDNVLEALSTSKSKTINKTYQLLSKFSHNTLTDFFRRILIFDCQERIQNIPSLIISKLFRPIRLQFRRPVYERLEGWWLNECINILAGQRNTPLRGLEVSERLGFITEQFQEDSLPIDFEFAEPENDVSPATDNRYFVMQLRAIGLKSDRIRRAILDYYRAFQQRNLWMREMADLSGELETYDDRLVDEWDRLREVVFEDLSDSTPEDLLQKTGRELLNRLSTSGLPNLRIRPRVTATFVTTGSYHILANETLPRVHWHPKFRERMAEILMGGEHEDME